MNDTNNNKSELDQNLKLQEQVSVNYQDQPIIEEKTIEPQKKNYCRLLIVFMVISILLTGYIVYISLSNKTIKPDNPNQSNNGSNVIQELIDDYKIVSERIDDIKDDFYLVKKSSDNKSDYEAVKYLGRTFESFENYFGYYNNKIYYSDLDNIKYIDLTDKNLTEKIWLKLPKCDSIDGIVTCFDTTGSSRIVGDSLYISSLRRNSHDDLEDSGFGYLNLSANSFDEYKEILDRYHTVINWTAVDDNDIYYSISDPEVEQANVLYYYDTKTKTSQKIMVLGSNNKFYYVKGNIIYCKSKGAQNNENKYLDNLFVYNINTTTTTKINEFALDFRSSCDNYFTVQNNSVYYLINNIIYKYNIISKVSSEYYKYINRDSSFFSGMHAFDDNNLVLYYPVNNEYISNGKSVKSLPIIKVLMLDKTVKEFSLEQVASIK